MKAICEAKIIKGLRLTGDFENYSLVFPKYRSQAVEITPDILPRFRSDHIVIKITLLDDQSKYWGGSCKSNHRGIEIHGYWLRSSDDSIISEPVF